MNVVGFGGTQRNPSTSVTAMRQVLDLIEAQGHAVELFDAARIDFPMYDPGIEVPPAEVEQFLDAIRRADGIVIATPGYHGGVSGLVKNAIDWLEELREDERPYLDGRSVGLVVVSSGAQATSTTLTGLRSIVHALRGWPTPYGLETVGPDAILPEQLQLVADQVLRGAVGGPPGVNPLSSRGRPNSAAAGPPGPPAAAGGPG
jgi:FMN reductase